MAKELDYKALIQDTLLFRCEYKSEVLEEFEDFFGEDKIYTKEFAESLIDRWGLDEDDIKEYTE